MKKLLTASVLLALLLTSCAGSRDAATTEDPVHPYIEEESCALTEGESLAFDPCEVTLYYPEENASALGTAVCTVAFSEDVPLPAACVDYLLSAYAGFPPGTQLTAMYVCSGTAIVCLSANALTASEKNERDLLVYSVADTLLSLGGITGVAVTAGGRLLEPGLVTKIVTDTRDIPGTSGASLCFRKAGDWLEPVQAAKTSFALPEEASAELSDPFVTSGGYTTAALHIRCGEYDPVSIAGAALTALFSSPGIDRVILTVNDSIMPSISCHAGLIGSDNGLFDSGSLLRLTGSSVILEMPEGGKLRPQQAVCGPAVSRSPLLTLRCLLARFASDGILANVTETDALSCRLSGKVLSVNMSAGFYASCQALSPEGEKLLVYSIVNTLTGFMGISGVRFYIDGGQADVLAHSVYLKTTLIANPGLTAQ